MIHITSSEYIKENKRCRLFLFISNKAESRCSNKINHAAHFAGIYPYINIGPISFSLTFDLDISLFIFSINCSPLSIMTAFICVINRVFAITIHKTLTSITSIPATTIWVKQWTYSISKVFISVRSAYSVKQMGIFWAELPMEVQPFISFTESF